MTKKAESEFEMQDPFNPKNVVSGTIYRTNEKYGSLLIKKVNGVDCEQFVHATPKFYYPSGVLSPKHYREGKFPPFDTVKVYEKIDGTNIFMFRYKDANGNFFTSYKTRLVPFLKSDGYNDLILMWNKMLDKYRKKIEKLITDTRYGFAFEMFGSVNKILVEYKVPLDIRLIYAIDADGNVIAPDGFDFDLPVVITEFKDDMNPDNAYKNLVEKYETMFNDGLPVEGCMMYVLKKDGKYVAWKCKPPSVFASQCEGSERIGYNDAYTTAMNAMESCTIDNIVNETYDLLAEVYEETLIELAKSTIDRAIADAKSYILFRRDVVEIFKGLNLKWNGITMKSSKSQKDVIMRPMMQTCKGKNAANVFNVLLDHFTVFGE